MFRSRCHAPPRRGPKRFPFPRLPGISPCSSDIRSESSHDKYNVICILTSRIRNHVLQYKAKWEGYDPDDNWYDADSFINSASKVKEWLEAAQKDEVLQLTPEDLLAV